MTLYSLLSRQTRSLKQITHSKFIGLGIWAIVCILIYDRAGHRLGIIGEFSQTLQQSAYNILITDQGESDSPYRLFDQNQPKLVILLAYQRVGSSFTGQMFNQNPDMFYLFEPVDGIYSAMYGTQPGYAVPSDIAFFWNGTKRQMPSSESVSVAETLGSILSCDFDKVPTEVLVHKFFGLFRSHHKRLAPYVKCFRARNININTCKTLIKDVCPTRFGSDPYKETYCRNILWHRQTSGIKSPKDATSFQRHLHCMNSLRANVSQCMPLLNYPCSSSKVRVTKTVRLTMETAEYMLSQFSNLRIIHLIRDPRAVALSRMGSSTFRGKLSGGNMPREAQLYCTEVLKDILVRKRIEQRFPGSAMQVIYEKLVGNSMEQTKAIYAFLNETMPPVVEKWVLDNTEGAVKNSSVIAEKWQKKMTFKMAKEVSNACSDMYKAINYRWPQ